MTRTEWAPSRFRLALFRLFAVIRLEASRLGETRTEPPRVLTFEPGAGPWETSIVSVVWFAAALLFVTAAIARVRGLSSVPLPLVVVVAIPLTFLAITVVMWTCGALIAIARRAGLFRHGRNDAAQSVVFNVLLIALAIVSLQAGGWIRVVGVTWLALVALDALAFLALRLVASRVKALDDRLRESVETPFPRRIDGMDGAA